MKIERKKRIKIKHDKYNKRNIFSINGWKCSKCGVDVSDLLSTSHDCYPNIDHITPLSKGGTDTLDNIRTLCRKCNMAKSDMLDGEWEHLIKGGECLSTA